MITPLKTIKGTKDILPLESPRWRAVEAVAAETLARYRYREIRTPIYESTELYTRGIGENTDIVGKEMFSFDDRGGRHVTLRPEGTAGVVRAYIEHKLYTEPSPQKLWYFGPMFRAENVQAGRQRQFHQLGVECLGSHEPRWDAEVIVLAADLLARWGLSALEIQINSVGCSTCRPAYREKLQTYLRTHLDELCGDCQTRTEKNPLRVLDCKVPKCAPVIVAAPQLDGDLCEACQAAFAEVTALLDAAEVTWQRNPRLVRGLDYYTRTVFEIITRDPRLGAQNTVCAGGRYNDLVGELGGPETPAVGWGLGIERLMTLLGDRDTESQRPRVAVVMAVPGTPMDVAFKLAITLRTRGDNGCILDLAPVGKLDKQFKYAERINADYALILGESEVANGQVTIRDLKNRKQQTLAADQVDSWLTRPQTWENEEGDNE